MSTSTFVATGERQRLDDLNQDYAILQMQRQKLGA